MFGQLSLKLSYFDTPSIHHHSEHLVAKGHFHTPVQMLDLSHPIDHLGSSSKIQSYPRISNKTLSHFHQHSLPMRRNSESCHHSQVQSQDKRSKFRHQQWNINLIYLLGFKKEVAPLLGNQSNHFSCFSWRPYSLSLR
jgi:hypothetical protein